MPKSILIPRDDNGASFQAVRPEFADSVATGAGAAESDAFDAVLLLLHASEACYFVQFDPLAATPDPAAAGFPLPAEMWAYVAHKPGWKIAAQRRGADDGTLSIAYAR